MNNSVQKLPATAATLEKKPFDFNLEALRGVAALAVVWGHATVEHGAIAPAYYPTGVWSYVGPAHLSVLVFFVLSGYVIGISHKAALTKATILTYLKKRFVRIYPIYVMCLLLALVVAKQMYPVTTIISHLTMTQGLTAAVIPEFSPSWSLVYEIAFYLLFIPISFFRVNPIPVAILAALAGCVNAYFYPRYGTALFSSFTFGFAFWTCGLAIARYVTDKPKHSNYAFMLSFLLLFMAIGKLDAPATLVYQIGLHLFGKDLSLSPNGQPGVIALRDFGYLPYCIVILLLFASKPFRYQQVVLALLLVLPAPTLYYYYRKLPSQQWSTLVLPLIFYSLSIVLFLGKEYVNAFSERMIKRLIGTGSISYGLYIVHFPILYLSSRILFFSGSPLTFLVRLLCFLAIVTWGATVLETRFQPWRKRKLL
jgi:peptidoglycan/LPS O-acetylase OafA/YrhL